MSVRSFGNPVASFRSRFGQTGKRASKEVPTLGLTATGGTTSTYTSGSIKYKTHVFESSASPGFQVTSLATGSFPNSVDVLLAGGGGSGNAPNGGGGGGGGVIYSTAIPVSITSYPIVVGAGGAALNPSSDSGPPGNPGVDTTAFSLTAGGGGGGGNRTGTGATGRATNGSSGGSGFGNAPTPAPGNGTGGTGGAGNPNGGGGGGGGAGGNGSPGNSFSPDSSDGGAGILNSILGTSYYWAGGGGGSGAPTPGPGNSCKGGIGGGGGGGRYFPAPNPEGSGGAHGGSAYKSNPLTAKNTLDCSLTNAGAENTGGGGGAAGGGYGGATNVIAGNGGKGIVIVRYEISPSQS